MKRVLYFTLLAAFTWAASPVSASECGRPVSKDSIPRAVDSLYILQSAVGSRHCRLEDCDINADCRISVSDALGTLRSAVGDDGVELDCRSECPAVVPCGSQDAPMCNGTCPADQACMPVEGDGEDHDDRVTICHLPPGNPGDVHTLVVGESSVSAHFQHGDALGPCEDLGMGAAAVARDRGDDEHGDGGGDEHGDDEHGDRDDHDGGGSGGGNGGGGAIGSSSAGLTLYDTRCQFCHSAGAHDTMSGPGGQIAGEASELRNDLGTIDRQMIGIILTDQEIADLMAFLDSLNRGGPGPDPAECVCVPVTITTLPPVTTTLPPVTTTLPPVTTTTMGPSTTMGQAIYDSRCRFCHTAGAHDTMGGPGGQLARKGSLLRNDLGAINGQMTGLRLTNAEIADLAAFLNSL